MIYGQIAIKRGIARVALQPIAISVELLTIGIVRERVMNREYLSAKAELCSKLAVEQINNGDNEEEGVKNFKRMIRALGQIHLLDIEERRGRE
jgi:hypothetical protein